MLDSKTWVKLNSFPKSLNEICGLFEINDVFYVVGSNGIETLNGELYKYPTYDNFSWCNSYQYEQDILVVRKNYYDGYHESKLFNTTTKKWSECNIVKKRAYFSAIYYLKQFWVVGGTVFLDDGNYEIVNTIEIHDPVSKTTSLSPFKMIQSRKDHKVIVYNNKLYVFGGVYDNKLLNTVEMYSPDANKFITMSPMKTARHDFGCCRVGNLVYVMGGWDKDKWTNSVEIYNLDDDTWTFGEELPVAGYKLSACTVHNELSE